MAAADAWLLDFGAGLTAAIGDRELFHILYRPESHPVPRAADHCGQVIAWEGRLLPLWDLKRRLGGAASEAGLVAVVGFHNAKGGTAFGALRLSTPPQRIEADDAYACELSEAQRGWRELSKSCFARDGQPVPVLDLASMFMERAC